MEHLAKIFVFCKLQSSYVKSQVSFPSKLGTGKFKEKARIVGAQSRLFERNVCYSLYRRLVATPLDTPQIYPAKKMGHKRHCLRNWFLLLLLTSYCTITLLNQWCLWSFFRLTDDYCILLPFMIETASLQRRRDILFNNF